MWYKRDKFRIRGRVNVTFCAKVKKFDNVQNKIKKKNLNNDFDIRVYR